MKHIERSYSWPLPGTNSPVGSLVLLLLTLLLASCGGSGGSNPALPITPLGSDASLTSLSVSGLDMTPDFSSSDTVYIVGIPRDMTDVVVSATASDDGASLRFVTGMTALTSVGQVTTSVPLNVGENRIDLYVTAEDGVTTQTYTISLFIGLSPGGEFPEPPEPAPGSDASLSSLWVDVDRFDNLNPSFRPSFTVYRRWVGYGTADAMVSATATDSSASVTIIGATSHQTSIGNVTAVMPITVAKTGSMYW